MNSLNLTCNDVIDFSVIHSNLNGAKSHLDEFFDTIQQDSLNFTVIGVSETRLMADEERFFSLPGYCSLFDSRVAMNPGGGVGLFFRDNIISRNRPDLKIQTEAGSCVESVFGECSGVVANKNIIVGVVYRQPGGDSTAFMEALEVTLNAITREGKLALVMGDFNIDTLIESPRSLQLNDLMACYNFCNVIQSPTCEGKGPLGRSVSCIDHIWLNFSRDLNLKSGVARTYFSDHFCPFLVAPAMELASNSPISHRVRYDLDRIYDMTETINWAPLFQCESPDQAYEYFHEALSNVVTSNSVMLDSRSTKKSGVSGWATPAFLRLLRDRDAARRALMSNPNSSHLREKFRSLRNRATWERRRLKIEFNEKRVINGIQKGKSP